MSQFPGHTGILSSPSSRAIHNQPTSTADSATEDMAGDADEPPDDQGSIMASKSQTNPADSAFQKSALKVGQRHSLLTQFLHTSESDSLTDEDDSSHQFDVNLAQSNACTYSRGSATSMGELTSDGGHTSPRTSTPSPPLPNLKFTGLPPMFNTKPFGAASVANKDGVEQIAPKTQLPESEVEKKVEAGLGRKRCIMFACPTKASSDQSATAPGQQAKPDQEGQPIQRASALRFECPTRRDDKAPTSRPHTRLTSPPPPPRRSQAHSPSQQRVNRGSDSIVKSPSPKLARKAVATALRARRESAASDISHTEATRFHEFASSEEEVDDWTKESGCFQRRLTIDDTLEKELGLRKLGREVEEEEEADEEADEDEDNNGKVGDNLDDDDDVKRSVFSGYESDDGFQTDDEDGFAHSDDEDDGDSDTDWWTPGRAMNIDQLGHIRPGVRLRRSDSLSSTGSVHSVGLAIPGKVRRQRSRPIGVENHAPELPDSTDFVCGTLDEDKPLEQAYLNHLEKRRAAKRPMLPQDIDPTFPTSDPEIDDEEDEVSEHDEAMESDHPIFLHGHMELHDEAEVERHPRWVIPKKRSPLGSPRRLRSPPPAKRISLHRSPPPPHARRGRSPAAMGFHKPRLSSSVPRNRAYMNARLSSPDRALGTAIVDDDDDNTPRFNRGAIDIVMGLEKKRQLRREKMYERHCRLKAQQKTKDRKPMAPGKGAEKMRDLGLGLNAYRGKKAPPITGPVDGNADAVHILSY